MLWKDTSCFVFHEESYLSYFKPCNGDTVALRKLMIYGFALGIALVNSVKIDWGFPAFIFKLLPYCHAVKAVKLAFADLKELMPLHCQGIQNPKEKMRLKRTLQSLMMRLSLQK